MLDVLPAFAATLHPHFLQIGYVLKDNPAFFFSIYIYIYIYTHTHSGVKIFAPFLFFFAYLSYLNDSDHQTNFNITQR